MRHRHAAQPALDPDLGAGIQNRLIELDSRPPIDPGTDAILDAGLHGQDGTFRGARSNALH